MGLTTTVSKWGTSLGVRLPSSFAKVLGLKAGDEVEIALTGNALVLRAASRVPTIAELYASWDGQPYELGREDRQWLTAAPEGNEAW